jgi:D-amino-acid dehydrogenase
MIVPSHFTPLAAPGMVALGLKWMWNPESPFYIKPRLDLELLGWGFKFWRAATRRRAACAEPLLRDLNFASRAAYEELAEAVKGIGDFGLVKRGLLMLCRTSHTLDEEAKFAARANELGVPAEVLDAKQAAALDPDVTMDVAGAVYFSKDAHLSPGRFMAALQAECERMGVKFLWNTEVVGTRVTAGCVEALVMTPAVQVGRPRSVAAEDVAADEFVLAGGSWSPLFARELGLRLPMQAGKGYSLTLARPRELPRLCSICTEARLAVTPMGDTLRVGGTMEIAGLNEDINPARVRGITKAFPKYFPKFSEADFAGVQPWRGLRPCSPDGLPYLGRTAKFPNVILATGHAMMGLSLGPVTGRLVAEIVSDEQPSFDLALLSPDRHA